MGESDPNILCSEDVTFDVPPYTLGQIFFKSLSSNPPDNVIVVEADTDRSLTNSEFFTLALRITGALQEEGVQRGDCVTLIGKNGIDISAAATAALFLGAIAAPIDPYMKPFEYQQILGIAESKIIFCDAEIHEMIAKSLESMGSDTKIILLCAEPDAEYPYSRLEDFMKEDIADMEDFRPVPSEDTAQSIAFYACSSGTTGLPKMVMLPDRSMVYQIFCLRLIAQDRRTQHQPWLHVTHFFWISGLSLFMACTCSGDKRIIIRNLEPKNIMRAIDVYKPFFTFMAPTHIDSVLDDPDFDNYDLTSIKLISCGGSSLQKPTYTKILRQWPTPVYVVQTYGCTEVGGMFTTMTPGEDIASVGRLVPGAKMKVLKDDGETGGPGERGELCMKSGSMMNGYLKNEEATQNALDEDGWFHTGDAAFYKDELVYICGRLKELIKNQGLQIAPTELEELIHSVPGVQDVGVAGIKVDEYNYHPMALVVKTVDSDVTEEDIVKCVNENLSDYKQLRGGVCFVERIPRTPTGKIKRIELQSLAETLYMGD